MKVNKIFRVTLLAMLAALFAISMAYAESYTLEIDDDSELDFEIFTEYEDLEFYEGYNYYVKYHIPKLALKEDDTDEIVPPEEADGDEIFVNYELSWDFRPISEDYDFLTPTFTKDDSGDVLVLVGLLPESADSYGFTLTPKISGDYFESATINVSFDLSVEVVEFYDYVYNTNGDDIELWKEDTGRAAQQSRFRRVVSHDVSTDLNVVTHSYIVDVIAPDDEGYASYINSKDINLPYWLSFDITGTSNDNLDGDSGDYGVTSIRLKFNEGSIVADSTDAVVRIPLTEAKKGDELIVRVLGWPVTFSDVSEDLTPVEGWTPIELATTSLSFEFTSADREAKTLNAAFTNHAPVSYDVSCDFTATFATISVDLPSDTSLTSGNIPITVTPAVPSVSADHSAVITFVDSEDNKVSLDVTVKITVPEPPDAVDEKTLNITYGGTVVSSALSVAVVAGGSEEHLVLNTSGDVTGNIRWSVSNYVTGLAITPGSSTVGFNEDIDFTVKAAETLSADTYAVRITATLADSSKSAYVDVNVRVSAASNPGGNNDPIDNRTLNITNGGTVVSSALPVSVVAGGTEEHLVLNTSGDVTGNIRWSVTNNTTGLAITTSSSTVGFNEDIDFTFRAASTVSPGTYTVRITATLADSSESAYVDVTVRVFAASNPGGNTDPIPGGNSSDDHNPNENLNPDSGDRNNIAPDDSDSNRGGFSNERVSYPNYYTGTAAEPENSNFNINDVESTSTLLQTLSLSANTDIAYLPGDAILQSRDSVDPKEIPYDEQVILVFPTYRVSEPKVYVFGVLVEKLYDAGLNPGDPMYIKMAQLLDTGSFNSSQAIDSDYAAIIDSEGNVINKMPDLSADRVNIAAFFARVCPL